MSDNSEEYLISPRSCAIKDRTKMKKLRSKSQEGHIEFVICSSCKSAIQNKKMPIKGINNFLVGGFPKEFDNVTDIEWSYVSLLRTYAYFYQL